MFSFPFTPASDDETPMGNLGQASVALNWLTESISSYHEHVLKSSEYC